MKAETKRADMGIEAIDQVTLRLQNNQFIAAALENMLMACADSDAINDSSVHRGMAMLMRQFSDDCERLRTLASEAFQAASRRGGDEGK